MSDNGTVKGMQKLTTANTPANQVSFMIDQAILAKVNTAEVVIVTEVEAGGSGSMAGYVDVKPLVCPTDGFNNVLPPAVIYRLPYSRIQGGIAALVIDPAPGDIGLAVFAKRDCSGVKQGAKTPVQPASFRQFDQADGFYIGGFLNKVPEIWLELNQNKEAVLHAPTKVTIETAEAVINAGTSIILTAPKIELNGNLTSRASGDTKLLSGGTLSINASHVSLNEGCE